MIDIQINTNGIEFIIDIKKDIDLFTDIKAQIVSPTGNLIELPAIKDQAQTMKVYLLHHIDEIGIYEVQAIGIDGTESTFSEKGYFRALSNTQDKYK